MTTDSSEDLVPAPPNCDCGYGMTCGVCVDLLETRIEQLEREKAHKEKALEICKRLACQEGDEADTLARAFQIAHVIIGGRATPREQEFLDEALTIAKRRVNGE